MAFSQSIDSLTFSTFTQIPPNSFCFNSKSKLQVYSCLPAQSYTQTGLMEIPADTFEQWEHTSDISMGINPSSSNYLEYQFNFSNDTDTYSTKIRLGDKGDNITLFNFKQEIIAQTSGIFNKSSSFFRIRIVHQEAIFSVYWQWKDSIYWNFLGKLNHTTNAFLTAITIKLIQTGSSSVSKWNFSANPIQPIQIDTIPPKCIAFRWTSNKTALIVFNEAIAADNLICQSSDSTSNYTAKIIPPSSLQIEKNTLWPCNDSFTITILGVTDTLKNTPSPQKISAYYPCIIEINSGELSVTEIMHNPPINHPMLPSCKYIELQNTANRGYWLTNSKICDDINCISLPNYWLKPNECLVLYDAKDSSMAHPFFNKIGLPVHNFPSYNSTEDSIVIYNHKGIPIYQNNYRTEFHQSPYDLGGYSLERAYRQNSNWLNWQSNISMGGSPGYVDSCLRIPLPPNNSILSAVLEPNQEILLTSTQPLNSQQWKSLEFQWHNSGVTMTPISPIPIGQSGNTLRWKITHPDYDQLFTHPKIRVRNSLLSIADTLSIIFRDSIREPQFNQLIISEIQFNASENKLDFIEFYNNSSTPLNLNYIAVRYYSEDSIPKWQLPLGGKNAVLLPQQCLVLCKDAEQLRISHPDLPMDRVIENNLFPGLLADFGLLEIIHLPSLSRIHLSGYNTTWHHPEIENTPNISLVRIGVSSNATHAWDWKSHDKNPSSNIIKKPCEKSEINPNPKEIYTYCSPGKHELLTLLDAPGTFKLNTQRIFQNLPNQYLCLEYQLPAPDCWIQVKLTTIAGHLVSIPVMKDRIAFQGNICFPTSSTKLPVGTYLILVKCLLPTGSTIQKHLPFSIL